MPRYLLLIEYHGAPYVGWQRQSNGRSIQQVIEESLGNLEPDMPRVHGAGRTDSGVHAIGQVAHVDLQRDWDPDDLLAAVNSQLVRERISVRDARSAAADFHARHDAVEREYRYRIECRKTPLAIEKGLAWHRSRDLDAGAMAEAAGLLVGTHDFTTFRSAHCQADNPRRTLRALEVTRDGTRIEVRARAQSFLHRQVRSMVGTLERVGAEAWRTGEVAEALAARDRAACGPLAPPEGLYLESVRYE